MRRLDATDIGFSSELDQLLALPESDKSEIDEIVRNIIAAVKKEGDDALLRYSNQFDHLEITSAADLEVSRAQMAEAVSRVDPLVIDALKSSIDRVRVYHEKQLEAVGGKQNWQFEDADGNSLGQVVRSMQRVGIYAPGGKACYPSTIIMTAIPAKVAGVEEIILTVPTPNNELSDVLLAAAHLCGVDRMFRVGGAQAIAALAFGTKLIPRVDKIVGPGNIFVATAKGQLFGQVGIDMIAGPSEVVIVADDSADVDWLVMDLFAQAEHDELAQSILISTNRDLLEDVADRIPAAAEKMNRRDIINASLDGRGGLIYVPDNEIALQVVNRIAPEHLELAVREPETWIPGIRFAGAIFVGHASAEVVGDYTAGPSHVLPTSGTARFASPLGVTDFIVRTSLIHCSPRGAVSLSRAASILATEEGLQAHSQSADFRARG